MKLLVAATALLLAATPAQAITWKEFWEPFDGDQHQHHYYHHEYPAPRNCQVTRTKRVWIPGYYTGFYTAPGQPDWIPGRWSTRTKTRWVPCRPYR